MTSDTNLCKQQLQTLQIALASLYELLKLDTSTYWLSHFERCLRTTDQLITEGFDQTSLNALSRSVRQVFGGMGRFNDHVPVMNTQASSARYRKHGSPERAITNEPYV